MKIYYVENVTGFNEIEQFYVVDFGFGFLMEFDEEGKRELTYENWDDFYRCWDRSGSFELCGKRGKKAFKKVAVIRRVE